MEGGSVFENKEPEAGAKRRSSHWKLETPGIVTCPKCGAYRLPHRMCKNCLTYNGRSFGQQQAETQQQ